MLYPPILAALNEVNSQIYIYIPREHCVISLKENFPEVNFDVMKHAVGGRNVAVQGKNVKMGAIASVSELRNNQ